MERDPRTFVADFERVVLGTALSSPEALDQVLAALRPGDLYDERHIVLVRALTDLVSRGVPVDSVTLPEHLVRVPGLAVQVGGFEYVLGLDRWASTTSSLGHYLDELRQASKRRAALAAADEIQAAVSDSGSGDEAIDRAVGVLVQASSRTTRRTEAWLADAVAEQRAERVRRAEEREAGRSGMVRTHYAGIDDLVVCPDGDVTVLMGLPSHGKSTLALNIADANAGAGFPTALFSLEMDRSQLATRWVGLRSGIPYQKALRGQLEGGDRVLWEDSEQMLIDTRPPLRLVDDFGATPGAIAARAWQFDRQLRRAGWDRGLRLVIVDYLQKVEPDRRMASREAEVASISRALKVLAGDLGCHVLALAQPSRASRQRDDKRPQLYDLRESGTIEQDASNVLGAYWHYKEVHPAERAAYFRQYEVIVLKSRSGDLGTVPLEFTPWSGRLRTPPPAPPAPSPPPATPAKPPSAAEERRRAAEAQVGLGVTP